MIARTPSPPYYAVIFTSVLEENTDGYEEMAKQMEDLCKKQDGFLGLESARSDVGITVCYWRDLESIERWKQDLDHQAAQEKGISTWYKQFQTRIAKVERDNGFSREG